MRVSGQPHPPLEFPSHSAPDRVPCPFAALLRQLGAAAEEWHNGGGIAGQNSPRGLHDAELVRAITAVARIVASRRKQQQQREQDECRDDDSALQAWAEPGSRARLVSSRERDVRDSGADDPVLLQALAALEPMAWTAASESPAKDIRMAANTLYALGLADMYLAEVIEALERRVRLELHAASTSGRSAFRPGPRMDTRSAALLCWGLAKLQHDSPEVFQGMAGLLARHLEAGGRLAGLQTASMLLKAYATVGDPEAPGQRRLVELLGSYVADHAAHANLQVLANTAWSLVVLGCYSEAPLKVLRLEAAARGSEAEEQLWQLYTVEMATRWASDARGGRTCCC